MNRWASGRAHGRADARTGEMTSGCLHECAVEQTDARTGAEVTGRWGDGFTSHRANGRTNGRGAENQTDERTSRERTSWQALERTAGQRTGGRMRERTVERKGGRTITRTTGTRADGRAGELRGRASGRIRFPTPRLQNCPHFLQKSYIWGSHSLFSWRGCCNLIFCGQNNFRPLAPR